MIIITRLVHLVNIHGQFINKADNRCQYIYPESHIKSFYFAHINLCIVDRGMVIIKTL